MLSYNQCFQLLCRSTPSLSKLIFNQYLKSGNYISKIIVNSEDIEDKVKDEQLLGSFY
jgi:hypothetical protein